MRRQIEPRETLKTCAPSRKVHAGMARGWMCSFYITFGTPPQIYYICPVMYYMI